MLTPFLLLWDAWQERKWRKKKFIDDVNNPELKESYAMIPFGDTRILIKVEY